MNLRPRVSGIDLEPNTCRCGAEHTTRSGEIVLEFLVLFSLVIFWFDVFMVTDLYEGTRSVLPYIFPVHPLLIHQSNPIPGSRRGLNSWVVTNPPQTSILGIWRGGGETLFQVKQVLITGAGCTGSRRG